MLDELHVRDVALIGDAVFRPAAGLTALTGETGAGKTALISALKLIMGERADASMVRQGAEAASVEARLFAARAEDARRDAEDAQPTVPDEGIVASRRVGADGRSRCQLNGSMAANKQLTAQVGSLIDLCGQHEHQRLLSPASHLGMLDAWAGDEVAPALEAYSEAFRRAQDAAAQLERVSAAAQASSAELDEARFTLSRIDEVCPAEGEYEDILARLPRIEHAESLAQAAAIAYASLAGESSEGALGLVNAAASALDGVGGLDAQLGDAARTLREASFLLEDVARDMRAYRDEVEFDPEELARLQERASAMQGLMRSFGPTMADVFARRAQAEETVRLADDSQGAMAQAQRAVDKAEAELARAARELDGARRAASPRFAEEVSRQMARLEMGSASLVCEFTDLPRAQWSSTRCSSMEFLYRPGAKMQARPLARIASGGEMSRVMLACKVVLGARDAAETLVFDEVDAGVGGTAAVALSEVLADLAQTHQVIVVTHLAQVAVRAQRHVKVSKSGGDRPETTLDVLEGEERVAEVARMLSGSATETALAHAREMLA